MAANKKLVSTIAAVATSAALLLGGTLAWQSANQTALNEASDVVNPGGRLHDDFFIDDNGDYNADIYVENFAEEDIFARVKLQEYMEVIMNYGTPGQKLAYVLGSKSFEGDDVTDKPTDNEKGYDYEYVTHYGYTLSDKFEEIAGVDQNNNTEYWTWTMGSPSSKDVYYIPTFNMNKDSLVADRNGMYVDRIGGISNRGQEQYYTDDRTAPSWTVWTENATKAGTEIWDIDYDTDDEVSYDFENLQTYADAGDIKLLEDKTHTAKLVGKTMGFISMDEWLAMLDASDEGYDADTMGNHWVYDDNGWIYWSSPIKGGDATGLLLDSIELNDVMDDTWYYAINAIAQFVTADDVGKTDDSGFYRNEDPADDPDEDAERFLEAIGVDMSGEAPEEEEGPIAFRILKDGEDEGVNYREGETAYLDEGTYTLYVSSGEGGLYTGATPEDFNWSVEPDIDHTVNEISDNGEEGMYYVSVDFTLDDSVEMDIPITFTATNETDDFEMVATVVYGEDPDSGEDVPEVIDMPLDVYVKYDDGTYAGAQPTDPETGKLVEGVIQIFSLLIDQNPMNLGATLTTVDGGLLDSSSGAFDVTYSFDEYESNMSTLWNSDAPDEEYTFTISTVEDEGDELYGYQVATCNETNQPMVALHPTTGRLLMLAEEQPINQSVYVTATTTYNGETYESNSQCLFFINRDIIMHVDWVDAPADDPGHSGEYTPDEETTFTLKANLYIDNVEKEESDFSTYPITWSVKDSDGNDASDVVKIVDKSDYTATVTVTGDAAASRYIVSATYIHDDDDGRNKGEYSSFFGINSTEGGDDDSDSTLEMTFSSSSEYTENGDGTATIEIDKNRTEEFIWNLYGCSEGKFTLSSNNEKVTFEPYSDDDSNLNFDMDIIIPVDVTENFTVTATSMDGTKSVVFHVVMTDNPDNT